eukprot:596604-Karenia_brevis.AAC.1
MGGMLPRRQDLPEESLGFDLLVPSTIEGGWRGCWLQGATAQAYWLQFATWKRSSGFTLRELIVAFNVQELGAQGSRPRCEEPQGCCLQCVASQSLGFSMHEPDTIFSAQELKDAGFNA